jgi:hypothetical protein
LHLFQWPYLGTGVARRSRVQEKALAEADKRRAETEIPTNPGMLVEFFLNSSAEDIEYFIAKARPQLDSNFFAALDSALGRQRCACQCSPTRQHPSSYLARAGEAAHVAQTRDAAWGLYTHARKQQRD